MNAKLLPQSYLAGEARVVTSTVTVGGRKVKSSILIAALEQFFWVRVDVEAEQLLRTFAVAHRSISALAQRIALKIAATEVRFDASDFAR